MTATSESDDWETLLDSGQLDANIKKLTILQRPKADSSLGPGGPVSVMCSDDPRTQFKSSEPVIKIMKRPDGNSSSNSNGQSKPKVEQKSLKQREQEYAEARQRILGSETNVAGEDTSNHHLLQQQTKSPVKYTVPPPNIGGKNTNGVARHPKGPPVDGSKGFHHHR